MDTKLYNSNHKLIPHQTLDLDSALYLSYLDLGFYDQVNKRQALWSSFIRLISYLPQKNNYILPTEYFGIHGLSHLFRVLFYVHLLQEEFRFIGSSHLVNICYWCAAWHDTGRLDDRDDPDHGKRSAENLIKSVAKFSPSDQELIFTTFTHHNDVSMDIQSNNKDTQILVQVLRTADMLDRFRLVKSKWWPKPEFFFFKETPGVLSFARHFSQLHETLVTSKRIESMAGEIDYLQLIEESFSKISSFATHADQ